MTRRPGFASTRHDSTTSAPASSSRNAKRADVSKTTASATTTVLRPTGEQGFGQPARPANMPRAERIGLSSAGSARRESPALDLLPDRLKLLRRQCSDLIQYSFGLRADGFNNTREA